MNWQPIETMPEDGVYLVWDRQYKTQIGERFGEYVAHHYDSFAKPTHWMPLPEPPHE